MIGGERITTESKLDSFNPANRTQLVGSFNKATKDSRTVQLKKLRKHFKPGEHAPRPRARCVVVSRGRDPARAAARVFGVDDLRSGQVLARS